MSFSSVSPSAFSAAHYKQHLALFQGFVSVFVLSVFCFVFLVFFFQKNLTAILFSLMKFFVLFLSSLLDLD